MKASVRKLSFPKPALIGGARSVLSTRKFLTNQNFEPDRFSKAIEDSTGIARSLWISFIIFGTYLAITVSGADHKRLFLALPIELPVFNVSLPLVTFFWIAPIFFLIFHLYLMLNVKLLVDQIDGFENLIVKSGADQEAMDTARLQLPNFILVQVLAGTSAQRASISGVLLNLTAFLTLVLAPLGLMLFIQLMFLPYHSHLVTNAQRLIFLVDLALVWYFWTKIRRSDPTVAINLIALLAGASAICMSCFILAFPGEINESPLTRFIFVDTSWKDKPQLDGMFFNTLNLVDQQLVDPGMVKQFDDHPRQESKADQDGLTGLGLQILVSMRNRDLSYARFTGSIMDYVNFQGANLIDSDMSYASLKHSVFGCTEPGSSLCADLRGAKFDAAHLENTQMRNVNAKGASFVTAYLNETDFSGAILIATDFRNSVGIESANVSYAQVAGGTFDNTNFPNATGYEKAEVDYSFFGGEMSGHWKNSIPLTVWTGARATPDDKIIDYAKELKKISCNEVEDRSYVIYGIRNNNVLTKFENLDQSSAPDIQDGHELVCP